MLQKYIIERDYHNSRLDKWFKAKVLNIPQSLIEKIIRKKKIKVNKKKTKTSYRVQMNDTIEVFNISEIKPIDLKKNINKYKATKKEKKTYGDFIIEDNDNFIVINKPSGIPVQGGTKSFKNITDLLSSTKYFENKKAYIVHRLDKETSGVLIIAKNREYAQLFTSLFRIRKIHKNYLAIVHGEIPKNKKTLEDNLVTYQNNKKVIQKAITHLKIIKNSEKYSLLELKPITGRKHQLRKQLFNLGNPIVGDNKYSVNKFIKFKNNNLMLHASKLKFMINDVKYNFEAKYNQEFDNLIKKQF
ncbi:MAG: hypothetical protein CNC06_04435 [Pelagibacterales bacterium MED-G40]|nr:MAG: hypothetical protein CNC06_04435 [Pelagibacterales bacterium MED-G40]|tara:strand:- start:633 stop:1535 length:903 start_codon:yes stop_codon:yes gene_type:complete